MVKTLSEALLLSDEARVVTTGTFPHQIVHTNKGARASPLQAPRAAQRQKRQKSWRTSFLAHRSCAGLGGCSRWCNLFAWQRGAS